MLSDKMRAALNDQINLELESFYVYLSMSAHFEDVGLPGMAAWLKHHADEEMMHAMKIYDYVISRRGKIALQAISAPPTSWEKPLAAFEDAFGHERKVSIAIDSLVQLAREERDYATDSFLQWFVDEQVEEEEVVDKVIQRLRLIGDFGAGLYMLDQQLAAEATSPGGAASAE